MPYHGDVWVVEDVPQGLEGLRDISHCQERDEVAGVTVVQHQSHQHPQPQHQMLQKTPFAVRLYIYKKQIVGFKMQTSGKAIMKTLDFVLSETGCLTENHPRQILFNF